MSGIVGLYDLQRHPIAVGELAQMTAALKHRGPDNGGLYVRHHVGLGHRMLWTTAESCTEKLPALDPSGRFAITADARIDNRSELAAVLGLTAPVARGVSDSALILAAYLRWGEQCVQHLLGAFAFAIWDDQQERLFCARDHFGVKPFYYHHQADRLFVFASEIKALFCAPAVPRQLNEVMVADFLLSSFEDRAITFFQQIYRLPAAHVLLVSSAGLTLQRYWTLDGENEVTLPTDDAYAEMFRAIFTEAVACRLRSVFPVGASFSGGLDSSSVVCVAHPLHTEAAREPALQLFSCYFDELPQCDERIYIEAVTATHHLTPHVLHGDQLDPLGEIEQIFGYLDEPCLGPNLYLPWSLSQAAKNANVRVLLDGFDGDTTVSHGDFLLTEWAYQGEWALFAAEARQFAAHFHYPPVAFLQTHGLVALHRLARRQQWRAFACEVEQVAHYFSISRRYLWLHHGLKPNLPTSLWGAWRKLRGRAEQDELLINRPFARRIQLTERRAALAEQQGEPPVTLREEHRRALMSGGIAYVLELNDKVAAAATLEARHPFMDKRLVEFCLALPASQKLNHGWSRRILREAMRGILPEMIRQRQSKTNLEPNFVHTLLKFERARLDALIFADPAVPTAYLDWQVVQAAYRRLLTARYRSQDIATVWKAVNLTLWLRCRGFA
jgi:asparagine synthase (glutamine-hydrolysing)